MGLLRAVGMAMLSSGVRVAGPLFLAGRPKMNAQIARLIAIAAVFLCSARALAEGSPAQEAGSGPTNEATWRDHIARLDDPDAEVRQKAAFALRDCSDPEAVLALIEAFKHKDPLVRGLVIDRFRTYSDHRTILPLIECLKDSNPSIRSAAINVFSPSSRILALCRE